MIETTRKCKECKNLIVLEKERFLIHKSYYIHYECFVKSLTSKKRNPIEESEARKQADLLEIESKRVANDIIAKNHLYKWLQKKYDLVVMPSYIFQKFDAIFDGTFKGMEKGVPAEDLLDMFERQWNYLCSLNLYKRLDGTEALNYDIAVILAKTSSYYKWKDQVQSNQQEVKQLANTPKINFENFCTSKEKVEVADYIIEEEDSE